MEDAQITAIEDAAARAVPAAQIVTIGGWRLRATPGLSTRRANSVLARDHRDGESLDDKLDGAERFYAEHCLPTRFQLCPASRPAGLERVLLDRGYRVEAQTAVHVAPMTGLVAPTTEAEVTAQPTDTWWQTWSETLALEASRLEHVAALFGRIVSPAAFATVSLDRTPVAVGLGVHDGRWLSIHNMATRPGHRGRGAGSAVLASLLRWGREQGAQTAYLQVETGNTAALALYRRAAFHEAYAYRYLTQDVTAAGATKRPS